VLFLFTPLSLQGTRVAVERGYKGWRRRILATWLPLLVNFEVIALWHGAKGTFVLFGIIHGAWYVIETEIKSGIAFKTFRSRTSEHFRVAVGMAFTILPLMLTFALFRSASLFEFWSLLSKLVAFETVGTTVMVPTKWYWVMIALVAVIVYLLPNGYEILRLYRPGILTFVSPSITPTFLQVTWRPNPFWALFVAVLTALVFTRINHLSHFLYQGF
jgi:alginate O-acetyltransferase complex protein AlgI